MLLIKFISIRFVESTILVMKKDIFRVKLKQKMISKQAAKCIENIIKYVKILIKQRDKDLLVHNDKK